MKSEEYVSKLSEAKSKLAQAIHEKDVEKVKKLKQEVSRYERLLKELGL